MSGAHPAPHPTGFAGHPLPSGERAGGGTIAPHDPLAPLGRGWPRSGRVRGRNL
jgi:hypothetical protein